MPRPPTRHAAAGRGRRRRPPPASRRRPFVARLVLAALVCSVVVAGVLSGCLTADRGVVPAALVGVWRGPANGNASWCYELSGDGKYRAWPERAPGAMNTGTVVVDQTTIWFSNGGAPVRSTWSLADGVLFLDGKRFVRAAESR